MESTLLLSNLSAAQPRRKQSCDQENRVPPEQPKEGTVLDTGVFDEHRNVTELAGIDMSGSGSHLGEQVIRNRAWSSLGEWVRLVCFHLFD